MIKKKPPPAGAPDWVLTYGDMMSLLLCFFILLAAFADYEKGGSSARNFQAAIDSIHQTMGIVTPGGNQTDPMVEFNAIIQEIRKALQRREQKNKSNTSEVGAKGKNFRLRRIRDGMEITLGGPVIFEPFSSQLTAEGQGMVADIAAALKGHRNMCEVRGHAADEPAPAGWSWDDAVQLSYQRSKQVADALVAQGVEPRSMRLMAVGPNEPVKGGLFGTPEPGQNRRVEVIIRESTFDDFINDAPATQPAPPDSVAAAPFSSG